MMRTLFWIGMLGLLLVGCTTTQVNSEREDFLAECQLSAIDPEWTPEDLVGTKFYEPADNKQEEGLRNRLESLWPKYYKK